MVEIIEAERLMYGSALPVVRVRKEKGFFQLAKEKKVPYIIKQGRRLFFNDLAIQYSYVIKDK